MKIQRKDIRSNTDIVLNRNDIRNTADITELCEIAFKEKNEGNYRLKCTPVGKGGD